jgi:transposase
MATAHKVQCDVCGKSFKEGGLGIHKARAHNGRNWSGKAKRAPKKRVARKATPKPTPTPRRIVLQEVWSDHNGRMLLVDQNGDPWSAKKLEV